MTNDELKEALTTQCPIVAKIPHIGETEFAYVSGIIYRSRKSGKIFIQAELMDKSGNAVVVVNANQVRFLEREEAGKQEKTE